MRSPINLLLLFFVVALVARFVFQAPPLVVFLASALAIVPLAKWMGNATEELALRTGPGVGGLLNASFGNATELIIAIFALRAGLVEVVKASITGSIIGNILFVLGLSILLGGWKRDRREGSGIQRTAGGAWGISAAPRQEPRRQDRAAWPEPRARMPRTRWKPRGGVV